ncbi:hypothetical protein BN1318_390006 [Staphylococcus capitis]|nr:hypothetical protein BN1318_390006 [Staphylococcus capitis]
MLSTKWLLANHPFELCIYEITQRILRNTSILFTTYNSQDIL